ncbi:MULTISPECIES: antitoxin [Xenorhabdus]|uniref:antitoxin n=1 Tax=Xenorhabdus TaxID=626 RepID=UPI0006460205|nr:MULTISPECIES: antitoxin [Xenorhabdus]MBC8947376.1 antitoxin [Xenorhabdus indica]
MSRLTIDITDQQHKSLKALAALQGKTIKQYTLERLFPDMTNNDQAWQELKALLNTRINEGIEGKVSGKSIDEILNEELAENGRD